MRPLSHKDTALSESKEQASLTLPTRYATPCSLAPAFGIEPAFRWATSTSAGRSTYSSSVADQTYIPSIPSRESERLSTIGDSASTRSYRQNFQLLPPRTPSSTSRWIEETSRLSPASARSKLAPSIVTDLCGRRQTPRLHHPAKFPENMSEADADADEHLLVSDFDVDGSVSSSGSDDDAEENEGEETEAGTERAHAVSKYIDDVAQESRIESGESDADSSYVDEKTSKRAKASTPSIVKKTPAKKALKGKNSQAPGEKKRQAPPSGAPQARVVNPLRKWIGSSQGPIEFTPKPYNFDHEAIPLWTYSSDGITRQSPTHRAVGDIHFSPSLALGEDFHYWVQVGTNDNGCWELYYPGRQHPVHAGYALKETQGKLPPRWVYRIEEA